MCISASYSVARQCHWPNLGHGSKKFEKHGTNRNCMGNVFTAIRHACHHQSRIFCLPCKFVSHVTERIYEWDSSGIRRSGKYLCVRGKKYKKDGKHGVMRSLMKCTHEIWLEWSRQVGRDEQGMWHAGKWIKCIQVHWVSNNERGYLEDL